MRCTVALCRSVAAHNSLDLSLEVVLPRLPDFGSVLSFLLPSCFLEQPLCGTAQDTNRLSHAGHTAALFERAQSVLQAYGEQWLWQLITDASCALSYTGPAYMQGHCCIVRAFCQGLTYGLCFGFPLAGQRSTDICTSYISLMQLGLLYVLVPRPRPRNQACRILHQRTLCAFL